MPGLPINVVVKSHIGYSSVIYFVWYWVGQKLCSNELFGQPNINALITECMQLWYCSSSPSFSLAGVSFSASSSANECSLGVCCVLSGSLWQNFCRGTWGRLEPLGQPAQAFLFGPTWNGWGGSAVGVGRNGWGGSAMGVGRREFLSVPRWTWTRGMFTRAGLPASCEEPMVPMKPARTDEVMHFQRC